MRMLFVPSSRIWAIASRRAPSPIESIDTTAATPNTTPSAVSRARSVWARMLSMPTRRASEYSIMVRGERRSGRSRPAQQHLLALLEVGLDDHHAVVALAQHHGALLDAAAALHVHDRLVPVVEEHRFHRNDERLIVVTHDDVDGGGETGLEPRVRVEHLDRDVEHARPGRPASRPVDLAACEVGHRLDLAAELDPGKGVERDRRREPAP